MSAGGWLLVRTDSEISAAAAGWLLDSAILALNISC
jgi:hypothetical protein